MKNYNTEAILSRICERVYSNAERFNGGIPSDTTDIDGKFAIKSGGSWTDSFFIGILNLAYLYTKNDDYMKFESGYNDFFRKRAENDPKWCEENNVIPLDHDTGFIFMLSEVYRYKLTGDAEARDTALTAVEHLAARFNEKGGFIRAWDRWEWDTDPQFIEDKKGKIIADSMMNLSLLFWAWEETGDKRFYHIAVTHADTVMKYIVRPDGSTYHQYNFDRITGIPKRGCTGQGYADDSCWSRGQAWVIYGFTQCYKYTGDARYLETALKAAEYFINNLTAMGLALWDFACRELPFHPYDSSACAIALSGLISLDKCSESNFLKNGIDRLCSGIMRHCSALDIDGWESLLLHACGGPAYSKGNESQIINPAVDTPMIYGDYYFFESMLKLHDERYIEFIK